MNPKVSIIVPVYNVQEYIAKTIESLTIQNYNNYEILLIDDGSLDFSGGICDEYAKKYDFIKVFHKENGGVTSARKFGIEKSTGEWILFVDGDDQLSFDAVNYLVSKALMFNACIVNTPFIYKHNSVVSLQKMKLKGRQNSSEYITSLLRGEINHGIGGKLYAKHLFHEEVMNISPIIKNNEDLIMNLRLSKYVNVSLSLPDKGVYFYEYREGSASRSLVSFENRFEVYKEIRKSVPVKLASEFIIDSLWNAYLYNEPVKEYLYSILSKLDIKLESCDFRRKLQVKHIRTGFSSYYYIIKLILFIKKHINRKLWK